MSDAEDGVDIQHEEHDDNAHQACYIYQPFAAESIDSRPSKKRKTKHVSSESHSTLPQLLQGMEFEDYASRRFDTFQRTWDDKQAEIDQLIAEVDCSILAEVVDFVELSKTPRSDGNLPCGLVVFGPDSSVQDRLLHSWKSTRLNTTSQVLIQLRASSCPNLQTALKNTIKQVLYDVVGAEGYTAFMSKHKWLVPMNFDLELLQTFVRENGLRKVVISIVDVETFDTTVLSQFLWTLSSWSQRIPFVTLLGIATTVDLFESRLPKSTIELLSTTTFYTSPREDLVYQAFEIVQHADNAKVFLGPTTVSALHEASQSQSTTIETFRNILKVTFMSHYFANSLCLLSHQNTPRKQDISMSSNAIRNTDSFRQHCEDLLEAGSAGKTEIQMLLNNDDMCFEAAAASIATGQASFMAFFKLVKGLKDIHKSLGLRKASPFLVDIDLYNYHDELDASETFKAIVVALKDFSPRKLSAWLENLSSSTISILEFEPVIHLVRRFPLDNGEISISRTGPSKAETPSKATATKSMRKPSSASKTNSKTTSDGIPPNNTYDSILETFISHLTNKIRSHRVSFDTFMNEAFIINSRQPLLSMFTPRPRQILERALSKPADYLDCDCSAANRGNSDTEGGGSQHVAPPSSILYSLLQEAGTIINVRDLFEAFQSHLDPGFNGNVNRNDPEDNEDEDMAEDEGNGPAGDNDDDQNATQDNSIVKKNRVALCLFYQSLAELKMLGMVKTSTSTMVKKRALAAEIGGGVGGRGRGKKAYAEIDFIAKTSWAGL